MEGIWIILKTALASLCFIGVLHLLWIFARDRFTAPKIKYFVDSQSDPNVVFSQTTEYPQLPQQQYHQQQQYSQQQQYPQQQQYSQQQQAEIQNTYLSQEYYEPDEGEISDTLSEFVREEFKRREY